jgi:uncharacterized protein YegL
MTEKSSKTKTVLHVGLLLDESGSMTGMEPAVIGGVNEFVEKLRAEEAETRVSATLGCFDRHAHDPVVRYAYAGIPLEEVDVLGSEFYRPRGATPLNDAVLGTIRKIDEAKEDGDRAILVILTDGLENASETSSRYVGKLISDKEAEGWEFIYLGANQDSWADSGQIAVQARGRKFDYEASSEGTRSALRHSAARVKRYREAPDEYHAELAESGDSIREDGRVERKRRD